MSELAILNSLTIGSLTISGNSINTIGQDLEIQPLKQGNISFLGGAVLIDTEGNLKVEGNAQFSKDVKVGGVLSAQDISVKRAEVQILSNTEIVATGSSALVTLRAGETELRVNNEVAKANSAIFITPKTEIDLPIYVKNQSDGSFIVGIKVPQLTDILFNFLIVN